MQEDLKEIFDRVTRDEIKLAPEQDWSRCRKVQMPDGSLSGIKDHAKIGIRALLANPYFGLYDEMGAMKSAQTIIAAQFLYLADIINRVIVLCPATVRDVWYDKDLGELSLHLFGGLPARISEFHTRVRQWDWGDWTGAGTELRWIITNYEFVRAKDRLKFIGKYCGPKTLLVLDESSAVRNKTSQQSKSCLQLRRACGRVVQLNGTPIADTPMDLMNQANILHPTILDCRYILQFRQRYCVMNPRTPFPQILEWKNLDDIQRRMAPYVLRRLKEDCLDLPPKLPPVALSVPLTPATWKIYKAMKDDMVAWVDSNQASIAGQAIIKSIRLCQVTSGLLGGVEQVFEETGDSVPGFMQDEDWFLKSPEAAWNSVPLGSIPPPSAIREIGREKIDAALQFYAEHLEQDPAFKLVIWCRFRAELFRFEKLFRWKFPSVRLAVMVGGQNKTDRSLALRLLHPRTAIMSEPAVLLGTAGTGALGHNFTAAHVVLNMSYDQSLFKSRQSSDRNHRPGQTKAVSYFDLVATGPAGQKTMDHIILKARKNKDDIATWTAAAWLDALHEI
ncbi:hypothetical protein LCGC14_1359480 [marine sediment metagenome]|uniref:SNF2 N-terminal domain-containing protein n=1 Tax=marine sediment metagenome TaxID=412755 RepID=A0A0F9NAT7_9ZZZZ